MRNRLLIGIVVALFAGYLVLELVPKKPYDWSVTYNLDQTKPFGMKLLRERMVDIFPGKNIKEVAQTPSKLFDEFHKDKLNYMIFAGDLEMSEKDVDAILQFANSGNTVFIAAETFSGKLGRTLYCDNLQSFMDRTDNLTERAPKGNFLRLEAEDPALAGKRFPLMDFIHYNYFSGHNYGEHQILGRNQDGHPVFVRFQRGEGQIFIHSVPLAFTNYYMVDPICHQYISQALSYMPVEDVWLDTYYKPGNIHFQSGLSYLMDSTSLRWAWILALVSVVVFILFDGKRRQRIIPKQEPLTNSTLEFVETVSRLYLGHADHKDIADKKIKFLLEYVRSKWLMDTSELNEAFEAKLASKSGVPMHEVRDLFVFVRGIQSSKKIEPETLMKLNRKIESFYINCH